ncbi:WecB/TagA/CpsF family glycosyltransferase [Mucilaginibacter koreensis]
MLSFNKVSVFGVNYAVVDYASTTDILIENAKAGNSFGMSALAVHGLIEAVNDPAFMEMVNRIDLVAPDGQPVKWAMNHFYKLRLLDRVSGPALSLMVLKKANEVGGVNLYLYGSKKEVLDKLVDRFNRDYPNVKIVGIHPDRFREATPEEDQEDIDKINASGANMVWVGRGCPRQEKWVANHLGKVNAVMMAIGAAFDFHAGTLKQAPLWMQSNGLEWLYRLYAEPGRLWKRYLFTNSKFIYLFIKKSFNSKKI